MTNANPTPHDAAMIASLGPALNAIGLAFVLNEDGSGIVIDVADKPAAPTENITPIGPVAPGSTLTVCDPCYLIGADEETLTYGHAEALPNHGPFALSALTEAPLAEGVWEAYAFEGDEGPPWGERVYRAGVRLTDGPQIDDTTEATQGVDAGMVGFFINRPAFKYTNTWSNDGGLSCMGPQARLLFHGTGLAWITDSGFGDGGYPVTAHWSDGKVVAVEAVYIGDDEDDLGVDED